MRQTRTTVWSRTLWGLAALVVTAGIAVHAEEPADAQVPTAQEPSAAAGVEPAGDTESGEIVLRRPRLTGGLRAHIDPETGTLMVPPAKARGELVLSPELEDALSTSHRGLRAVRMPSGLTYVDLQGRFQSATFATIGEDGEVRIHHAAPPAPEAAEAAAEESAGREETP